MKNKIIVISGICATTIFTGLSYVLSFVFHQNYKEPQLLGKLINKVSSNFEETLCYFSGGVLHYLIGIAFAKIYELLIRKYAIRLTFRNGAFTGILTGLFAIIVWFITLQFNRDIRVPTYDYLIVVFIGHVLFGIACFKSFQLLLYGKGSAAVPGIKSRGF